MVMWFAMLVKNNWHIYVSLSGTMNEQTSVLCLSLILSYVNCPDMYHVSLNSFEIDLFLVLQLYLVII